MFLDNLEFLMKKRGLNKNSLSVQSGIPYTTIDGFFKRSYENTKLSTLKQLANFFEVDLDFLIYGKKNNTNSLTSDEKMLVTNYRGLNLLGKDRVQEYTKDLTGNKKYTSSDEERSNE